MIHPNNTLRTVRFCLALVGLALSIGAVNVAEAGLLFPEIVYDSSLGPGQNIYGTQGLHFTAGVGFTVSAKALAISYDGINFTPLVNGTVDFHARFLNSFSSGGTVTGHFTGVGGSLPDLIVADSTGVLLGTNYWNRTISADTGSTNADTDSRFTVVSGSLASYYAATGGNGRNTGNLFDVLPTFSASAFSLNFDGNITGKISPVVVPVPAAVWLFGSALAGLGVIRKGRGSCG